MRKKRIITIAIAGLSGVLALAGCQVSNNNSATKNQRALQTVTSEYQHKLTTAEPYPLSQMNDSAERANLRERLLRLNDPNKIGYFYELTNAGTVFAFYTVKGKVSATGSQLTNVENVVSAPNNGSATVSSMEDDGSFGQNECDSMGVFFFDTSNVMHEWCGQWAWSDAPAKLSTPPILVQDTAAKPSTAVGENTKQLKH